MSNSVVCPECHASTELAADAPATGTIPCQQCGIQIPVPTATPASPAPPAPAKAGPPPLPTPPPLPPRAADTGFEVLDDDEDEEPDDRPPVGRRSSARNDEDERPRVSRSRGRDDDDDEDERPRPSRSRGRDDDDDEDDRPRSRSRDDEDEDEDERPRPARSRARDDDEDEDERPKPARSRGRDDDEDEDDPRPTYARARGRGDDEDEEDDRPLPSRSRPRDDDEDEEDDAQPKSARARSRDEDDEEDEEDDPPPKSARARRRDDDEDDDEAPRKPGRAESDDDEEEDDERPRRVAASARATDDDDEPRKPAATSDDDDEEDESPRRSARATDVDDDDDEESPRRPKPRAVFDEDGQIVPNKRRSSRDDDDEDDDDYDDQPRKKSGKGLLLVVGLLVFLMLGAGGAVAAYVMWFQEPDKTVAVNNPPPDDPRLKQGPQNPDAKGPEAKVPEAKKAAEPKKDPDALLPIKPVQFDGDRKTIALPGKVTDMCAGGDGRFLFLCCPEEKKLLVFDVSAADVVKALPIAGTETIFTAGARKLLIIEPATKVVHRFDLVTMEKDKDGPIPFEGNLRDIALGSGSNGPALVITDAAAGPWPAQFLDVDSLTPADVGWQSQPPADLPRDIYLVAAANGSRWIGLPKGKDARGAVIVARDGKQASAYKAPTDSRLSYAAFTFDGNFVYSQLGFQPARPGVQWASKSVVNPNVVRLPSVTGSFEIDVEAANGIADAVKVSAMRRIKTATVVSFHGLPQPFKPTEPENAQRFIHYVPDAQAVYAVPASRDKVEVAKLDSLEGSPKPTLAITSTPPDSFTPGKPFEYRVRVLSNSPVNLWSVSGLVGATADQDGIVRWTPPADEKRDRLTFLVSAGSEGRRVNQNVTVFNTAAPGLKTPEPKKDPKKDPVEPKKSPAPNIPVIAAGAKLVQPSTTKSTLAAPEMMGAHVEVALPGKIRDACVGGGGRYLVFHVPTARKLVLFDTNTLKVIKTLPVTTDDLLFAAGMDKLVVVYPTEKVVIRYDLATLKLEMDQTLEVRQKPTLAAMGSATAGPLILGGLPAQNNASKMSLTFLELQSLNEVKIDKVEGEFKVTTGAAAFLRASADGRTLGVSFQQLQPSGLQIAKLEGNAIKGAYLGESVGQVLPAANGQRMYTDKGAFDLDAKPVGPRETMVPAIEGAGYLSVAGPAGGKRSVSVWGSAADKALATLEDLPGFDGKTDPFERDNPNLALDKRLFWAPNARVLIVVPPAADRLHVYQVGAAKK